MYEFTNLKTPINIGSGVADYLLLAPLDWFQSIKEPQPPYLTPGAEVTIFEDHVFKAGKGFIQINLAPLKNELNAKGINEIPSATLDQQLKVFIPGSYALLHETFKNLLNTPLIVLAKDANCKAEMWYQLGSSCKPAYLKGDFTTGTTKEGVKGYDVIVSWINQFIQIYEGLISKFVNGTVGISPVFLANLVTHDIRGSVDELEEFFNESASTDISEIYQLIVNNAGSGIIQLSMANDQDEEIYDYLLPVNLESEVTFQQSLIDWLAENGTGQSFLLSGNELRLVDPGSDVAFFGIAIPINVLGWIEGGNTFVLADEEQILIT